MSRKLIALLFPAALMLLGGCVSVESVHPLSSPRTSIPDHRLEGMWRSKDQKSSYYVLISYRKNGMGSLMYMGSDDGGGIDSLRQDFFVTHAAKGDYLNLSDAVYNIDGKVHRDHPGTYTFAKYRFSWLGQLITAASKGDAFGTAVEQGKLKGKLTRDSKGNLGDVLLTDSSSRILDFIESSKADDVFDSESRFSKISGK